MSFFRTANLRLTLGIVGVLAGTSAIFISLILKKRRTQNMPPISDLLQELQKSNVYVKDPDHVKDILADLVTGGKDKLQVIADFDNTLTCFTHRGRRCDTCHNVLDECRFLPDEYKQKAAATRDHYYAIEVDPKLTVQEKIPYMVEWWTKAHDLLLQFSLTKVQLEEAVRESKIRLRDGCDWMFQKLHKANVPLLIFSAGIGDILQIAISQQSTMFSNMKIVSNFFDFNSQGKVVGFHGEMIHVFNKNENAIHKSDYFETLSHRENVVLMGDSLGDLRMAEGATAAKHILKIGFLNDKIDERLETYMGSYDIVITKDETNEVVNTLLKGIV